MISFLNQLSTLLSTQRIQERQNRVSFFLFYDYRLCLSRQRLKDVRGFGPASTLLLVHWDLLDAQQFHSFYNKLDDNDTAELY